MRFAIRLGKEGGVARRQRITAIVAVAAAMATAAAGASAQKRQRISPDTGSASRAQAQKLARTIAGKRVAPSAAFAARPPYGRPTAVSTKRLAGFPLSGRSYAILGNGDALFADDLDGSGSTGANAGGPSIRGSRDVTIWRINLRVPRAANCLSFRFRFLSEEFPEFVGEEFNDAFIAELDETNWDTNTILSPSIDAPRNFATDPTGNEISVNSTDPANVTRENARGTTYDAATRVLRASTPITPGRHRLYLSVFDQGDRQYDSVAFVDRLTVRGQAECRSGVVPG